MISNNGLFNYKREIDFLMNDYLTNYGFMKSRFYKVAIIKIKYIFTQRDKIFILSFFYQELFFLWQLVC